MMMLQVDDGGASNQLVALSALLLARPNYCNFIHEAGVTCAEVAYVKWVRRQLSDCCV